MIAADMRLYLDANGDPRFDCIKSVAAMALMPFFSAFLLDSYSYIVKRSPELARAIEPNREVLKHSRLRLKPLEIHGKRFEDILKDTNQLARINWTCPGTVDTFLSRSVLFFQSNLLELGGAY